MRKPPRQTEPAGERESPWSRVRDARAGSDRAAPRPERPSSRAERPERSPPPHENRDVVAPREVRLYGLNACLAAFAKRPEALRKVYLTEARMPALRNVLAWCVKHRLGYRL